MPRLFWSLRCGELCWSDCGVKDSERRAFDVFVCILEVQPAMLISSKPVGLSGFDVSLSSRRARSQLIHLVSLDQKLLLSTANRKIVRIFHVHKNAKAVHSNMRDLRRLMPLRIFKTCDLAIYRKCWCSSKPIDLCRITLLWNVIVGAKVRFVYAVEAGTSPNAAK